MKKKHDLNTKAIAAMKAAIKGVIAQHKKSGRPLPIWENGKLKYISPNKL